MNASAVDAAVRRSWSEIGLRQEFYLQTGMRRSGGIIMRMFKRVSLGLVLAASLVGVSSASAANWDPPNTTLTATQVGTGVLTDNNGTTISCGTGSAGLIASGDAAHTESHHNPVIFSSCSNSIGLSPTNVTTTGTWRFTATSTTSVDITATNPTGPNVADITIAGFCTVSVPGPVHITGTWNNTTHQLTTNSANTFPISPNAGCLGAVGSSARLATTFQLPSNVIIT
jgi:hypothetical protein